MGTTNKETLKGYFKAGSIPKESNFADLIDSVLLMDGEGKVGIGTTNPNAKLNVQQDITMDGDIVTGQFAINGATTPGKRMLLGYDTNANGFGYIKAGNLGQTWTPLSLQPNGGNVGIGTTAPTHKFHVLANEAVGLFESTGGQAYLRLSTKEGIDNRVEFTNRPGGRASIWVSKAGDAFNVLANGNVGIGTMNPTEKLEVAGDAKIKGQVIAANSEIYFTNTEHNHSGLGNKSGWAAIENSKNFNCLMILGRNTLPEGQLLRVVKVWDQLWIANQQVSASDIRDKTNVEPLQLGLSAIKELRPVRYNWLNNKEGQKSLGLIAQEVLPVVSEAVHYDESKPDEPGWGISYQSLIPVLINAIKELDVKIESIQTKRAEA